MILLSGQCYVNESTLTGESVPVIKADLPHEGPYVYNIDTHKKHTLYCGTTVLESRSFRTEDVLGVAVQTGFQSVRGGLIRYIMFPKPHFFEFYRDAFKFIGVLAVVAFLGFLVSLIWFVRLGVSAKHVFLRAADLITIVVPPALPIAMTVATVFAVSRLKKEHIFCISPPRVNIAGKVSLMCFDKTGTLTEDGLDLYGFRAVENEVFLPGASTVDSIPDLFEFSIVTCHSLVYIDEKIVGDPFEVVVFESSAWNLETATIEEVDAVFLSSMRPPGSVRNDDISVEGCGGLELGVLKRNDFMSELQRMSVIVKNLDTNKQWLFVKGSPETLRSLSVSVPSEFGIVLHSYAAKGYRVIAYGYKELTGLSYRDVMSLSREEAESDVHFLGFVVLENRIKEDTVGTISRLTDARIRSVMITGDNPHTSVSIARNCGMVSKDAPVYISEFGRQDRICWRDSEDANSLTQFSDLFSASSFDEIQLALTGDVLEFLFRTLEPDDLCGILLKVNVFARMSPALKSRLVEAFQEFHYITGFCGDGANDVCALKQAHFGLSLSEAEASIAAPFTSLRHTIASVEKVIAEGRASLATSFQLFKYMALYSMIQFVSVIQLYRLDSNLGDYQYLWVDLFLIMPLTVAMGRTGPRKKLAKKRPPSKLVSRIVLISLFFHIIISAAFQIYVNFDVQEQSWFHPLHASKNGTNIRCYVNTVLFLLSNFQYLWTAIAFSIAKPFRRGLHTNLGFLFLLIALLLSCVYFVLYPDPWTMKVLQLMNLPQSYRFKLLVVALVNCVVSYGFERLMIVGPLSGFVRDCGKSKDSKKMYKQIDNGRAHRLLSESISSVSMDNAAV